MSTSAAESQPLVYSYVVPTLVVATMKAGSPGKLGEPSFDESERFKLGGHVELER